MSGFDNDSAKFAPIAGPFAPSITGAVAATRYVGGTTSGAPIAGTFAKGDFVIAQDGGIWICTVAGSPGTWVAALTGTYEPVVSSTWIDAARFTASFGTPDLSVAVVLNSGNRIAAWNLDAATKEAVVTSVLIPASWTTFSVTALWVNRGTSSSGNVVWQLGYYWLPASGLLTSQTLATAVTDAAVNENPPAFTSVATVLVTGLARTGTGVLRLQPYRLGDDAADTLANDATLIGLTLSRLT